MSQPKVVKISHWNPSTKLLNQNLTIGFWAPRRGGKSTTIKHLYREYYRNFIDVCVVYTLSAQTAEEYKKFIICRGSTPNVHIGKPPENLIAQIDAMQTQRTSVGGKKLNVLLILDDCIDKKMRYSNCLTQIFSRGRHSQISLLFASQHYAYMASDWRDNMDLIFIGRCMRQDIKDGFAFSYLSQYDKKLARAIIDKIPDHGFLIITLDGEHYYYVAPTPTLKGELKGAQNMLPNKLTGSVSLDNPNGVASNVPL